MPAFIGETVEVEHDAASPRPIRFTLHGQEHQVVEVMHEWIDTGHGGIPPRSRTWYNRHHRRYYVVRTLGGDVFTMYLDYAGRKHPTWRLVSHTADGG